jgi:hypothetical protein
LNVLNGTSLEGRLAGLEEQLAEPERAPQPTPRADVDERLPLGVEQLEPLPILCVREKLQAGISVGRVVLDVEIVCLETQRLLLGCWCGAAPAGHGDCPGRHGCDRGHERDRSDRTPHLEPPSSGHHQLTTLCRDETGMKARQPNGLFDPWCADLGDRGRDVGAARFDDLVSDCARGG